MRLEGIQTGDIVEVDRGGRRFHAIVTAPAPGGASLGCDAIGIGDARLDVMLMAQRSTSAMCALYQFMNRLIDRLMVR